MGHWTQVVVVGGRAHYEAGSLAVSVRCVLLSGMYIQYLYVAYHPTHE